MPSLGADSIGAFLRFKGEIYDENIFVDSRLAKYVENIKVLKIRKSEKYVIAIKRH